MATDVSGFDPLSVSLRDYVDGMETKQQQSKAEHSERHDQEAQCQETVLALHEERHTREHEAHAELHSAHSGALKDLIGRLSTQREEDTAAVERALQAVERAAQIHALAHEQQHQAHQGIHDVEKEAIGKASAQMDRRLEGLNQFRDALRDQSSALMPRELALSQIDAVRRETTGQIEDLRGTLLSLHSRLDVIQGQSKGASSTIGYFIAAATLILSAVVVVANLALT